MSDLRGREEQIKDATEFFSSLDLSGAAAPTICAQICEVIMKRSGIEEKDRTRFFKAISEINKVFRTRDYEQFITLALRNYELAVWLKPKTMNPTVEELWEECRAVVNKAAKGYLR